MVMLWLDGLKYVNELVRNAVYSVYNTNIIRPTKPSHAKTKPIQNQSDQSMCRAEIVRIERTNKDKMGEKERSNNQRNITKQRSTMCMKTVLCYYILFDGEKPRPSKRPIQWWWVMGVGVHYALTAHSTPDRPNLPVMIQKNQLFRLFTSELLWKKKIISIDVNPKSQTTCVTIIRWWVNNQNSVSV